MKAKEFLDGKQIEFKDKIKLLPEKERITKLVEEDYKKEKNSERKLIKWGYTYSAYIELVSFLLYNAIKMQDCKSAGQVLKNLDSPYLEIDSKIRNSFQHLDFKIKNEELYAKRKNIEGHSKISLKERNTLLDNVKEIYFELKEELMNTS